MAKNTRVHKMISNGFNLKSVLQAGRLNNELDYERALIAERKLRLMVKELGTGASIRRRLRAIIASYENQNWSTQAALSKADQQWMESEWASLIAEKERQFLATRKQIIKKKLKQYGLKQQDLMFILGHTSKSYMSELMNGVVPFTLQDLVAIHWLLKIELSDLIPTFLSDKQRNRIQQNLAEIGNQDLQLDLESELLAP